MSLLVKYYPFIKQVIKKHDYIWLNRIKIATHIYIYMIQFYLTDNALIIRKHHLNG